MIVGIAIERLLGSRRWLVLYLVGGLAGEIAGYASWDPHGAGASVGLCGLIGSLLVLLLRGSSRVPPIASLFALYFVAGLVGYAAGGLVASVGLCVLVGVSLGPLLMRNGQERLITLCVGTAGLLGAITLAALQDIHGPAIFAGACVAALILWRAPSAGLVGRESPRHRWPG